MRSIQFFLSLLWIPARGNTLVSLCHWADSLLDTLRVAPRKVHLEFVCNAERRLSVTLASVQASMAQDDPAWVGLQVRQLILHSYCLGAIADLTTLSKLVAMANSSAESAFLQIKLSNSTDTSALYTFSKSSSQFEEALQSLRSSKTMTAELAANLSAASVVRLTNNIRVNAGALGQNCPSDPHRMSHVVEHHVSQLAEHLFADMTTVTPASVAQMLQSLPNVWISAATYDLAQTALEMKNRADKFDSLVPKLLSKRANLKLSSCSPHNRRRVAEPVSTAILLHHRGAEVPRIVAPDPARINKFVAAILNLLEEARHVRIEATSADTDSESLRVLKLRLKLKLEKVFDHENVQLESVKQVFAEDPTQFLGRVRRLLTRDFELIDRLACPRSQPAVAT